MRKVLCILLFFTIVFPVEAQEKIETPQQILAETVLGESEGTSTTILDTKKTIDQAENSLTELKNSNTFDISEIENSIAQKSSVETQARQLLTELRSLTSGLGEGSVEDFALEIKNNPLSKEIESFYETIGKEVSYSDISERKIEADLAEWITKNNNKIAKLQSTIEQRNQEIASLELSLGKKKNVLSGLIFNYVERISRFILAIFFIIILSKFLRYLLKKQSQAGQEKTQALSNFIKWLGNISVIFVVIIFFFSEFTKFLPFLAIVGTALGFALRDVISCIIAWFMLGYKESLYKVGDVIKIEKEGIFGKVIQISPTVTTVKELGLSGLSGAEINFPNKLIFEKSITNRSKMNGWTYITIDIVCNPDMNFEVFETKLSEAIAEFKDYYNFPSIDELRESSLGDGITAQSLDPKFVYDNYPHGLRARLKMLVMLGEVISMKSYLTKKIFEKLKETDEVEIRLLDFSQES